MPDKEKLKTFVEGLGSDVRSRAANMFEYSHVGGECSFRSVSDSLDGKYVNAYVGHERDDVKYKETRDKLMGFLKTNQKYKGLIGALEACFEIYPYDELCKMDRKRPKEQLELLDDPEGLVDRFYNEGYPKVTEALKKLFKVDKNTNKFSVYEEIFIGLVIYVLCKQRCIMGSNKLGYEQMKYREESKKIMEEAKKEALEMKRRKKG